MHPAGDSPLAAHINRRSLFKGLVATAGVAALPGLAACSSSKKGSSSGGGSATSVSFGSNASDTVPKSAYAAVFAAAKKDIGLDVSVNTVDHNTFQQNITTYLQGNPQDVFTWFAGERMQFFAAQGLLNPVDDVWNVIGANYTDAMKAQSKGTDGHYYFVPFDYYPWAVFYRKSVFQQKGYSEPKTWDDFKALAAKMKSDGLIPIAFTDKDGWPAMGTFDYLNMRLNGYQFHIDLMRGKNDWTDSRVKDVFNAWTELIPYYSQGFLGLTWQEGANQIVQKQAGMMVLGLDQIGTLFTGSDAADLGFFAFPKMGSSFDSENAVEAPIDGFLVSQSAKNKTAATKLLEYMGKASTQQLWLSADPADIATANGPDTSKYTAPQTAATQFIQQATHISQFMDRDTRPDFADPVMLPAIQQFLGNPGSINSILSNTQKQKQQIWSTSG